MLDWETSYTGQSVLLPLDLRGVLFMGQNVNGVYTSGMPVAAAEIEPACAVAGTVTSGGMPLAGAIVRVGDLAQAVSQADGSYSVLGLPTATYRVSVEKNGYMPQILNATTISGRATMLDSVLQPASQPTTPVPLPRCTLSRPIVPRAVYRWHTYSAWGTLKPRHTAGTYPVRVYAWYRVSGRWVRQSIVSARATNLSSYSKYTARLRFNKRGSWRLRAYAPADDRHQAGYSAYTYFYVR